MRMIAVALAVFCLAAQLNGQTKQPNIVLFLADDLGWADVPWHGSQYKMPNLAALAQTSLKLESHYVHPMCSPTRAAFMTGRYASRFGVTAAQNPRALPWNTATIARALKTAGYDTAAPGAGLERRGIRLGDVLFQGIAVAASAAATVLLGMIVYQVVSDAWPAIQEFGLAFVWGMMLLVTGGLYYWFRKKDWI